MGDTIPAALLSHAWPTIARAKHGRASMNAHGVGGTQGSNRRNLQGCRAQGTGSWSRSTTRLRLPRLLGPCPCPLLPPPAHGPYSATPRTTAVGQKRATHVTKTTKPADALPSSQADTEISDGPRGECQRHTRVLTRVLHVFYRMPLQLHPALAHARHAAHRRHTTKQKPHKSHAALRGALILKLSTSTCEHQLSQKRDSSSRAFARASACSILRRSTSWRLLARVAASCTLFSSAASRLRAKSGGCKHGHVVSAHTQAAASVPSACLVLSCLHPAGRE